jgi:acetyltransferase-like isoleucine patch superfamily enzyme
MSNDSVINFFRNSEKIKQARAKSGGKGLQTIIGLAKLFITKGPDKFMNHNPSYAKYAVGDYTYGYPDVLDSNIGPTLKVGKFCSFAYGVRILLSAEHQISSISTYPFNVFWGGEKGPASKGDVVIGNDVWVGYGAIILSGVHIGDGAVVGAGAIVTSDVPPYAIVVGNPARVVKYRFEPSSIDYLLRIRWWDWPIHKIRKWRPMLTDLDGQRQIKESMANSEEQLK